MPTLKAWFTKQEPTLAVHAATALTNIAVNLATHYGLHLSGTQQAYVASAVLAGTSALGAWLLRTLVTPVAKRKPAKKAPAKKA